MAARVTTCAIHQPNFFPRASTIAKLLACDVWVVLDNVQFVNRDYQHRTRLTFSDASGLRDRWFTLAVSRPSGRASLLTDIRLTQSDADRVRFERVLDAYYGNTEHYRLAIERLHSSDALSFSTSLVEVGVTTTRFFLNLLDWNGRIILASDQSVRNSRTERLVDLVQASGAGHYLTGTGGLRYIEPATFRSAGVSLIGPGESTPGAGRSAIDVLMRDGESDLRTLTRSWQASLRPYS